MVFAARRNHRLPPRRVRERRRPYARPSHRWDARGWAAWRKLKDHEEEEVRAAARDADVNDDQSTEIRRRGDRPGPGSKGGPSSRYLLVEARMDCAVRL